MSDVVQREETPAVFVRCADEIASIRAACANADVAALERRTIPGGTDARMRLRGEPPAVHDPIGPTLIEYDRRRDEIDLLVPVG